MEKLTLCAGVTNPALWYPERPKKSEWNKIRKIVLERDQNTCRFCGYSASKWMNVHHVIETGDNKPDNLITCCVACHAVLHLGRNLVLRTIEVWETDEDQVSIVRQTREGVRAGFSLDEIKRGFSLTEGRHPPDSIAWGNELISSMRDAARAYLTPPLCAVFVKLQRWQLDCEFGSREVFETV